MKMIRFVILNYVKIEASQQAIAIYASISMLCHTIGTIHIRIVLHSVSVMCMSLYFISLRIYGIEN